MMSLFGSFTFTWWQVGLLKLSMVALGLAVGATWSEAFAEWLALLWALFVIPALYLGIVGYKQLLSVGRS
ncbi:MAG: hypothetical protein ACE5JN_00245 [Candidatus Methylomirabilia bacterium]